MAQKKTRPDQFLPLPHMSLNILLALVDGEAHGYGIKRFTEEQSDGVIKVRAGTLYDALARLHRDGLIHESTERTEESSDGRAGTSRWRYYRLSALGERVLRAELRRLSSLVGYARARQFLPEPEAS